MEPLAIDAFNVGLLMVVAFFASIISASSGFGGGLLITPFLIPIVGVKGVVPVMAVAMMLGNFSRVWVYRTEVRLRYAMRIALFVLPGVVLGTLIFQKLPPRAVAIIIGCFLIGSVPLRRFLRGRPLQLSGVKLPIIGVSFGVLTGSTPGAGVLLLSLLLGTGLTGPALIGTDAAIGITVHMTKATMFSSLDLLDSSRVMLGLMIGIATIPGAYVARWLLTRLSVKVHTTLTEILVVIAGLSFLWRAL